MENKFINLDTDFEHKDSVIVFSTKSMFKMCELMEGMKQAFKHQGLDELGKILSNRGGVPTWKEMKNSWFKDGVPCEILKVNSNGWQKGKFRIKITLQFCLDEAEITQPESPLDDIRRKINEVST